MAGQLVDGRTQVVDLEGDVPQPELVRLTERHETFRDVAAWRSDKVILDGGDSTGARAVNAQFVTPNFFGVIGVNRVTWPDEQPMEYEFAVLPLERDGDPAGSFIAIEVYDRLDPSLIEDMPEVRVFPKG